MSKRSKAKTKTRKAQKQRHAQPKGKESDDSGIAQTHHPLSTVNRAELVRAAGQQLPPGQRQTLIAQLGRQHGNQQLQRVAASLNGGMPVVQRQEEEQAADSDAEYERIASPVTVTIALGEPAKLDDQVTIDTYADLSDAYYRLASFMGLEKHVFMPDYEENEFWDAYMKCIADAEGYRRNYRDNVSQDERPYGIQISDLKDLMRRAKNIGQDGLGDFERRNERIKEEMSKLKDDAEEAGKEAKNLQRMKFLGGEPSTDQTGNTIWSVIDKLAGLGNIAGNLASEARPLLRATTDLLPKAVSLANLVANWSTTSPAMFGTAFEVLAPLNNVVALGNAAQGYVGSPFTIVAEYIGPMLSAVTAMLGKLQIRMIERNDEWVEASGVPKYVGAEPGGEKMWNYMVRTMRAPSANDVPRPSGEVLDYFEEFRELLGEHTSSIVPTEGMILQDINPEEFMVWLFNHREQVWISLYGERDPKDAEMHF